ncbi:hypothetical protein C0584_02490 [Candidatus Parcubacteria bacterium]|nr:MAG: hypothetical protein C0584_02490 [Candidatus Parcubacteria bacterium]
MKYKKDQKFREFVVGAIIITITTTAGYLIAPIEVRYLGSLTTNTTLIGLTYAIGSILFAFLSLYLGRLSDRLGRNRFIVIGTALGIIYPLMYASVLNIYQYMGVKFIAVFAAVSTGPIFSAYLQDLLKHVKKQGQYMGTVYAAMSILGAGAQFLGGFLTSKYGFAIPYVVMSLFFVLATILSLFELRYKKAPIIYKEKSKDILFGIKYIFRKPELVFYFINNASFGLNWGIKAMLWPLIIYSFTKSDTMTGSVFATMGIVAFLFMIPVGKMVDKVGSFRAYFVSGLILASSGLMLGFADGIGLFWIGAAIFAIGEAINGPAQAVLLTRFVETEHRGEIMGVDAIFDRTLNTISPFLAGMLLSVVSAQNILLVFVLSFWASVIASAYIYKFKVIK